MKITLLEDEYALRSNITDFLALHFYEVESYGNGALLLDQCRFDSDLYILDINVPGANGFEVIEWVRRNDPDKPVLIMTAYTDIDTITQAYRLGCSDYLKKPFDLMELLLRLQKLLLHNDNETVPITSEHTFNLSTRELRRKGETVNLTKNQRNLLSFLVRHRNTLIRYEVLIDEVWEEKSIRYNTIASHIRELRHTIGGIDIRNVRGEGYVLHVQESTPPPRSSLPPPV